MTPITRFNVGNLVLCGSHWFGQSRVCATLLRSIHSMRSFILLYHHASDWAVATDLDSKLHLARGPPFHRRRHSSFFEASVSLTSMYRGTVTDHWSCGSNNNSNIPSSMPFDRYVFCSSRHKSFRRHCNYVFSVCTMGLLKNSLVLTWPMAIKDGMKVLPLGRDA